jgi:glycosyltransferase involved in cell wall biosynthesis
MNTAEAQRGRAGPAGPADLADRLPRVLVLSQTVPQTVYAGSIVLYRLLQGYPSDRVLVVGAPPHPSARVLACRAEALRLPLERLERTRLSRLMRSCRACGLLPGPRLGAAAAVVRAFRPQVVVSVMQVQPYYHLAYRYARKNRLPLVLLVHDLAEAFEPVYWWAAGQQRRRDSRVYRYACRRLCVSREMCRHLEARYGVAGEALYPNRSEELRPRAAAEGLALKAPPGLTLGYAGALGYGYEIQLENMLPSFRRTGTRLNLYCGQRPAWAAPDVVKVRGYAGDASLTWARVQAECDAVVLPYPWAAAQQDLYRTHFPSKLTEYLALGLPVLIVGPPYANGVKWGLANPQAALTVADDDPAAWTAALCRLRDEPGLRRALSEQAVDAGNRDFDPVAIRGCFLQHLCDSAANQSDPARGKP